MTGKKKKKIRVVRYKKNEFLTESTSKGLIVTIKSTIDLCSYLTKWNYKYMLTGKIN